MLDWLSGWLRDIIAIVLLAAVIDLLLPNKVMQRYVRLVVGLIVLLTIITPLMRIFQGDLDHKLAEAFRSWDESSARTEVKMPTLEDIAKDAQRMSDGTLRQSAELAGARIEAAIMKAVRERTGAEVESVDAKLVLNDAGGAELQAVTVRLADAGAEGAVGGSKSPDSSEPVVPVTVDVAVGAGEADARDGGSIPPGEAAGELGGGLPASGQASGDAEGGRAPSGPEAGTGDRPLPAGQAALAGEVTALVSEMWSIAPERVRVTAA